MAKPTLFIGSSVESLPVADALQAQLSYAADVNVWNQGVFGLGQYALEALLQAIKEFDFGVFIFAADDTIEMRGSRYLVARDNVVLELGMFAGTLGRQRTFIVLQRTAEPIHLPSDLHGITSAIFDWAAGQSFTNNNMKLSGAIGPAAQAIRVAMDRVGQAEKVMKPLSGGMIFLALFLANRVYSLNELVKPFEEFQKRTSRLGTGPSGFAAKATKYACQCLEGVGLAASLGADEYQLTQLGQRLVASDELRERFPNCYEIYESLK